MLALSSVTQRYGGFTALDGVSLTLARGEFFGLLGPNGAGKSTLMSLVAGLRAPAHHSRAAQTSYGHGAVMKAPPST